MGFKTFLVYFFRPVFLQGVLWIFFLSISSRAYTQKISDAEADKELMFGLPEDSYLPAKHKSKLYLGAPSNIKKRFIYDPYTGNYIYKQTIGDDIDYRPPHVMTVDEYIKFKEQEEQGNYWRTKKTPKELEKEINWLRPSLKVDSRLFSTIFGGDKIEIIPQGSAELRLGVKSSFIDNPNLAQNQKSNTNLDFQQNIQVSVRGKIGTRVNLVFSQNTLATFNFENLLKLNYNGDEDQIIQKVELGNVALPLKTSLIKGSQTLFGARLDVKFGRLTVKSVASQERGTKKEISVEGGALVQEFEKSASDYEKDKHFFLGHYFRDNYENALKTLPLVNSQIKINKVEIWVSNINFVTQNTRNIVAFTDMGEGLQKNIAKPSLVTPTGNPLPRNTANNLYFNASNTTGVTGYPTSILRAFTNASTELQKLGFANGTDFETYENARKLKSTEYTVNDKLGYISLNSEINQDHILAVAYQYTLNGTTYQVGEFSTDLQNGKEALFVKLLKGTVFSTKLLTWKLMMKNVYSLSAYNVSPNNFTLDIYHLNPESGYEVPFIPEGNVKNKLLLNLLELDNVGLNNTQRVSDGSFDFIQGVTINAKTGKIIFPVLEPFGATLREKITDKAIADKYAFDSLYTTTRALAKQDINRDRFRIKGKYSSSTSSSIPLNAFNVPRGSVTVTAGGTVLQENVHYTVDYNLGRVEIIDDAILSSGKPIKISLGTQSLFNIQTKTFLGTRIDYKINDKFNVGGTVLNLSERPLTNKVNIGNEPINNTILGTDITYSKDLPLLTKLVDKVPFYSTKAKSSISFQGEFAHLLPGNHSAITSAGVAYLDDFEGAQTSIRIDNITTWELASTPQGQPSLFPGGVEPRLSKLDYNFNRAKVAWYNIDNLFWLNNTLTPAHIASNPAMQSNHYMRKVAQKEVFPFKDNANNLITNLRTFDLAYYPDERGPYNFDDGLNTGGIDAQGKLNNPISRWAGMSRRIQTTDFESANIEYIQFWLMDPFNSEDGDPNHLGGKLYFNLGNISEDILKDNRKSFENGMPEGPIDYTTGQNINKIDTTIWGRIPITQSVVNAFSNNANARPFQDIGLDGLNDAGEISFFGTNFGADPSADNFHHYVGADYDNQQLDILARYKEYNNLEGNSPIRGINTPVSSGWNNPNVEDLNRNNNLDQKESYYQYSVDITPNDLSVNNTGNNNIVNVYETIVSTPDGRNRPIKWIQIRIPIREPEKKIGNIDGFKSIRFMRMFVKNFDKPVVLRFARIELLRENWRKYTGSLLNPGDYLGSDNSKTSFVVSAVNIEENSKKAPVSYVVPPGIKRVINPTNSISNTLTRQNEQALTLKVCNLNDGDARAAYKPIKIDLRRYKHLKMFSHVEESGTGSPLKDNDLAAFVRLGTDFNNYYEYEIPLAVTKAGIYNTDIESDRKTVWPESNNIDIALDELIETKISRDAAIASGNRLISNFQEFSRKVGKATLKVIGNPNLKNVKTVLLGVRNYKKNSTNFEDDGLEKCTEVWFNELRMSDFDNHGGSAFTAKSNVQVADIGSVALSGNFSNPGFGSLEKKLNERQRETKISYDLSTSINLGKFFPKRISFNLPFFYSVSESFITPEFNTLDPDVKVDRLLSDNRFTPAYKDSIVQNIQQYKKQRSYNFTNVKKNPGENKKNFFLNFSNFSFNYSYSESFLRNVNIQHHTIRNYKGGINYLFNAKPKNIKPFQNINWLKGLKLIKDFNFNPYPQKYSFTTNINRMYAEKKAKNNSIFKIELPEFYQKNFTWDRNYVVGYKLTKSLNLNFNATNNAIIREPNDPISRGRVNSKYAEEYKTWQNTVLSSVRKFGTNLKYHQKLGIAYKVPINKIPYLNFLTMNTNYNIDYDWQRANIGFDTLGNKIQSNATFSVNTSARFGQLYAKIPYFKKLEARFSKRKRRVDAEQKARDLKFKHRKQKKSYSKLYYAKQKGWKEGKIAENMKTETKRYKNDKGEYVEVWREKFPSLALDVMGSLLKSVKSSSFRYTQSSGQILPNYKPESRYLGSSDLSLSEPGLPFMLGLNRTNVPVEFHNRGLLMNQTKQNYSYTTTFQSKISGDIIIRPINSLSVNLRMFRNYTKNSTVQFFKYLAPTDTINSGALVDGVYFRNPIDQGLFSMSFNSIFTAFGEDNSQDFLVAERFAVSQRLGGIDGQDLPNGYKKGYNQGQQDVLIPAFIANYTGKTGSEVSLASFTSFIPSPNWTVNFTGLSQLPYIKDVFQKVSLTHGYTSTLNISNFKTNINAANFDIAGNLFPKYQIASVNITEQFNPLIGVNVSFLQTMQLGFNYKRNRTAALSMVNSQITEVKGEEWTISTGYTIKSLALTFIKGATFQSDLVTRLNLSYRKNKTNIRKLVERESVITAGQGLFNISLTSDYKFSKTISGQAYFNYTFTNPLISTSFLTTNTKAGIAIRFTIAP